MLEISFYEVQNARYACLYNNPVNFLGYIWMRIDAPVQMLAAQAVDVQFNITTVQLILLSYFLCMALCKRASFPVLLYFLPYNNAITVH